jgi:hypothetical protein
MTTFRSEDVLVGLVGLVLLPLIANRVLRGLREGRLPVYRTYLLREDGEAKFMALLGLHVVSFFIVGLIAADLLLNLGIREAL